MKEDEERKQVNIQIIYIQAEKLIEEQRRKEEEERLIEEQKKREEDANALDSRTMMILQNKLKETEEILQKQLEERQNMLNEKIAALEPKKKGK